MQLGVYIPSCSWYCISKETQQRNETMENSNLVKLYNFAIDYYNSMLTVSEAIENIKDAPFIVVFVFVLIVASHLRSRR